MTLPLATSEAIMRNFSNDLIKWIGKIRHRRNHETDDENYINPVVRIGWAYLQGDWTPDILINPSYGITFDDYPIFLGQALGRRPTNEGPPTDINDFNQDAESPIYVMANSHQKDQGYIYLGGTGPVFSGNYYYGAVWIAIGKKD
jgi:hypothetical protein